MKPIAPLVALLIVSAGGLTLPARSSQTATISGVVFDSERVAIPGAQVTATAEGNSQPLTALSDNQGRFALSGLSAGVATIQASKPGYFPGSHGQRSPRSPGAAVEIRAGATLTGIDVPLWKHAVIAGRVRDADGEPLPSITVEALRRQRNERGETLVSGGAAVTDDRGEFRFSTLAEGTYFLSVRPSPARNRAPHFVYPGRLYPDARTTAAAVAIDLTSGQEVTGIDFRLSSEATSAIHGQVRTTEGLGREADVYLFPLAADELTAGLWLARTRSTADGSFAFGSAVPGTYVIRTALTPQAEYQQGHAVVHQMNRGEWATLQLGFGSKPLLPASREPGFFAERVVTIDSHDAARVVLELQPSAHIRGKVAFVDAAPPGGDELVRTAILLQTLDGRVLGAMGAARIETDGSFETAAIPPGRYGLNWIGLTAWSLKSVQIRGADATDAGLDHRGADLEDVVVTLTARPPELSGTVRDERGVPAQGVSVLVFPTDRSKWNGKVPAVRRFIEFRTNTEGFFRGSEVLEGEYFIVAPRREAPDFWQTPAVLERLSLSAARITLTAGKRTLQPLGVSEVAFPGR